MSCCVKRRNDYENNILTIKLKRNLSKLPAVKCHHISSLNGFTWMRWGNQIKDSLGSRWRRKSSWLDCLYAKINENNQVVKLLLTRCWMRVTAGGV